jgi:hypothetical protein
LKKLLVVLSLLLAPALAHSAIVFVPPPPTSAVAATATPAPTATPQSTATAAPTSIFTQFTKTTLTTDGSGVSIMSTTLGAVGQAAEMYLYCSFHVIGTKSAVVAISAGSDWATVKAWRIGASTTLSVDDAAFPGPGSGSNGFYTLALTFTGSNVQYTLTPSVAFDTVTSSSLTCNYSTTGQASTFAVL